MTSTEELIQNVVETIETATNQRSGLTELLTSIQDAKHQVAQSASVSRAKVTKHFERLQKRLAEIVSERMTECLSEIGELEQQNLEPLTQCEDMINLALTDATQCVDQGKSVLENAPEENTEGLLKFKDACDTKNLNILPEVPGLYEVANIDVSFHGDVCGAMRDLVAEDGRVWERAPVQVAELSEVPGGILVSWEEVSLNIVTEDGRVLEHAPVQVTELSKVPGGILVSWEEDEDSQEAGEFWLQYCHGRALAWDLGSVTFHTAYTGPGVSHLVTKLRTDVPYSFRVCCRPDKNAQWSLWSVPRTAMTRMSHYQWQSDTPGYTTSNEDKVGTRADGLTRVLYSRTPCYKSGYRLTFRLLDTGERSPRDGLGISVSSEDIETMRRDGTAFLRTDGAMYVDGQEMKTKLPNLTRNSTVTIETETLPNGKVRVSVQVEEKELTFDWNIERQVTLGVIGGTGLAPLDNSGQCFYFAMIFSHEDWKVSVE